MAENQPQDTEAQPEPVPTAAAPAHARQPVQTAAVPMADQPMQSEQGVRTAQTGSTSSYDLLRIVLIDPQLQPDQKQQLIDELRKNTPASDRWTFRWAIWILGLVVVLTIVAIWMLSHYDKTVPDGLVAIGSGAAGGLAGLLTPGRERDGNAQ